MFKFRFTLIIFNFNNFNFDLVLISYHKLNQELNFDFYFN